MPQKTTKSRSTPQSQSTVPPAGTTANRVAPEMVEAKPGNGEDAGTALSVRVLCVDDHEVLVEGLKAQFGIERAIGVVGWLGSAEHLIDETARLKPDVVLLDIEMPGPDAFETADRLRRMFPHVRVIFLSAHVRDGYISAAYNCGACGYFSKGDDLRAIAAGIREVAKNCAKGNSGCEFVMGPKVRERCLTPHAETSFAHPRVEAPSDGAPPTHLAALTEREIEVLRLIGKGLSRSEIAHELSRSAKTVDGHQDRIMKKLGIETRAELMRYAIREGLAEA